MTIPGDQTKIKQLFWKVFLMYSGRLLTAVVMWFAVPAVIAPVLPPPPVV